MTLARLIPVLPLGIAMMCCGSSAPVAPAPQPTPGQESGYIFTVMCSNCPGLTDVDIDRSVTPHRARLAVGRLTSVRAVAGNGCPNFEVTLDIPRWTASDPSVIRIEPSSFESAIVTALKPGVAGITADRNLPDGTVRQIRLLDAFAPQLQRLCPPLPELVFEVVP